MWFCVKCRKIVEEHIVIDLKIEERCKEIMENYEQRISDIEIVKEELQLNSCNEPMVKKIVEEVITGEGQNLQSEILARERQPKKKLFQQ
jgi:CRISPR/Cas system-associated endonuclease Cas3-HD